MLSDEAVLDARFPIPTITRPDCPDDIAAKRREFIRCSRGATPSHVGRHSLCPCSSPEKFRELRRVPWGSRWPLLKGNEISFEILL
jgi:hypothetical protein